MCIFFDNSFFEGRKPRLAGGRCVTSFCRFVMYQHYTMKFLMHRSNLMYDYMKVSNGDSVDDVIIAFDFIGTSELYYYLSVLLSHTLLQSKTNEICKGYTMKDC
jgi:hypothetical protein